jgi:hypothetical protein
VPRGKVALRAGDHLYEADFVKIALNVIRDQGSKENRLPEVLRSWFGDDAGQPGTSHRVRFHRDGEEWVIAPEGPGEVGSAPE